jgi:hypothetical protein
MPQYVIVYLGGDQPSSPEEGQQHYAKYKEWLSSLGDSAVSPANPFKDTSTVKPDGTVLNLWRRHWRLQRLARFLILTVHLRCQS